MMSHKSMVSAALKFFPNFVVKFPFFLDDLKKNQHPFLKSPVHRIFIYLLKIETIHEVHQQ